MTTLTVLICTYNRPQLLVHCLDALIGRSVEQPDQIVVVNGGDARTDEVVNQYASKQSTQVKLVKTVNKNLAASRNVGLPHCIGDIIAMTDDDAEVYPDWVTEMKQAHAEHPEAGAIGGKVIGKGNESLVQRIADKITFPSSSSFCQVRTVPGVNVSYKCHLVEKLGWQDETLFRGEDVDYNWRIWQLGYKVYFDPKIKVLHHHRSTLTKLLDQFYMYGRAYYLVRRKWPEMYCVYPHQLRTGKDVLKGGYFFLRWIVEPIKASLRMDQLADKVRALPILILVDLAWQRGIWDQRFSR
jgi:GT2 family glycosyltransferase